MAKSDPAPLDQVDPVKAWQPWQPDAANPWSLKWAGHLYRRAGFGATLAELRQAMKDGLDATFDKLFRTDAEAEERYQFLSLNGQRVAAQNNPSQLRGWSVRSGQEDFLLSPPRSAGGILARRRAKHMLGPGSNKGQAAAGCDHGYGFGGR
jgi:hypothetical protein